MICPLNSEEEQLSHQVNLEETTIFPPAFWTILGLFLLFGILSALNEKIFNPWEIEHDRDSFRISGLDLFYSPPKEDHSEYDALFNKDDPLSKETLTNTQNNIYVGIDHSFNQREEGEILSEKNSNFEKLSFQYLGNEELKKPKLLKGWEIKKSLTQNFPHKRAFLKVMRSYNSQTEPSTAWELSPRNRLTQKRVRFW